MLISHIGPMFSGKTTALINDIELLELTGLDCIVLTPAFDTRKEINKVITHDNKSVKAITITDEADILKIAEKYEVIAFDEIQFFSMDIINIIDKLIDLNKHVIVSGLDTDYTRKPFKITMYLSALSNRVIKHAGKCSKCSKESLFTHKLIESTERFEVGADDKYIPVCRDCYKALKDCN